jgi:hypothetical protein
MALSESNVPGSIVHVADLLEKSTFTFVTPGNDCNVSWTVATQLTAQCIFGTLNVTRLAFVTAA